MNDLNEAKSSISELKKWVFYDLSFEWLLNSFKTQ